MRRVGIIGTGGIARIALYEIKKIEGVEVTAVWARTREHGEILAKEYEIPNMYNDINAFLEDDSFDTVYVAIPNHVHFEYMKKSLLHGKHVICEKPFTSTALETKKLIQLAHNKNLFLFDGTANQYYENYRSLKEKLPLIGNVKLMHLNMSQISSKYEAYQKGNVYPVFDSKCCGGALYDLNSINVLLVVGLFGKPEKVKYYPNKGFNGIDTSGLLVLEYKSFLVECVAAKDSESQDYLIIQGDKGYFSMLGNPGVIQNVYLKLNGKDPECIDIERVEDQRENLFRKIFEIMEHEDYAECYARIEVTSVMLDVLEKARIQAGIYFGNEEKDENFRNN